MAHADFVHLRVRSAYSLSEGAIKIDELAALCVRHRMPAVAITDTCNLFGAMEFSLACADAGVQPIIGCTLAVGRETGFSQRAPAPDRLALIVQNETGWRNLIHLSSKAFLETPPGEGPQVSLDDVAAHADGLIALTGGADGAVGRLLAQGQNDAAEAMLRRLRTIFPGRLYVELQRHGLEPERRIEPGLLRLAYAHDVPLVATNDVFFADADMFEAHDVLLCIAQGKRVSERSRRRLTPEHRFKSAAEMRALFADLPEAVDNTLVIARRSAFMVRERKPILPRFFDERGRSEAEALREQARAGLARRLERLVPARGTGAPARAAAARAYEERLTYELEVITAMDFPGYFLIVADFVGWARRQGIPVGPGRGSGAGSVVAWALGITDLDPLRFGLLFERFLNPERVSMPDFDIDFCQERRDEVIGYVQRKYGVERVAQIITFGTLQARAALRDVGRVLELPYGLVDRICKYVPYNPASPVSLAEAVAGEPMLQAMRDEDRAVARMLAIADKLEGLYRHASTHAAGVVIAERALEELVPLYRDPRSPMPVTQFSMKYVEKAGLVKFDFLGLKTLTTLDHARQMVARQGEDIALDRLPLDDAPTYEMLGQGDTVGVFQLESAGMRDALRHLRPDKFEDIIALVALYRPGPMNNIPRYIACKHGLEAPDYLHPNLREILAETFGVIIYQEQVMEIARVLAGYTPGAADLLRRAMGKKIQSEMDAQRQVFVDGAVARGVPQAQAAHIFDLVARFAGYGFNKSHAAAYALVAYQTAYFKAHHPVAFFAASMTQDIGNLDKINVFRQELERLGIPLLPPDINRSDVVFVPERDAEGRDGIRYALAAVKNVGAHAVRGIVAERQANGPYRDLWDFAQRLDPRAINKRQLENLVCAGAFDALEANRARAFAMVETLIRHAGAAWRARESAQASLFGGADGALVAPPDARFEGVAEWPALERLMREHEALGFYLSAHPLDMFQPRLHALGVVRHAELAGLVAEGASRARLAGVVLGRQERSSAAGRFAFVRVSDPSATFEVAVFHEVLQTARELLEPGRAVLVAASVRLEGDTLRLTAQAIEDLEEAAGRAPTDLCLALAGPPPLARLSAILAGHERGKGRICLLIRPDETQEVEVELPERYAISLELEAALRALPGVEVRAAPRR